MRGRHIRQRAPTSHQRSGAAGASARRRRGGGDGRLVADEAIVAVDEETRVLDAHLFAHGQQLVRHSFPTRDGLFALTRLRLTRLLDDHKTARLTTRIVEANRVLHLTGGQPATIHRALQHHHNLRILGVGDESWGRGMDKDESEI